MRPSQPRFLSTYARTYLGREPGRHAITMTIKEPHILGVPFLYQNFIRVAVTVVCVCRGLGGRYSCVVASLGALDLL